MLGNCDQVCLVTTKGMLDLYHKNMDCIQKGLEFHLGFKIIIDEDLSRVFSNYFQTDKKFKS